jgi:hypothetical protein
MKKFGYLFLALFVILAAVFVWLVLSASPENAPQETITIELPDSYEN